MTIVLNNEEIAQILTMNDCLEVLEETFKELGNDISVHFIGKTETSHSSRSYPDRFLQEKL